ncbi:peptidylprolyl isomerase PrsA [Streptococcus pantholopis]|uniref:Foldase protein PrsA n=1 Tax=Streptococcus pantholopis TaxID=1811193 RepID=A0A172Q886_9STRE|nr:peptidylprolyl isomerase PrsA [Streptococcus pantholopis]AND79676.1 foldase PrsA [Streptococcus pantholopis]
MKRRGKILTGLVTLLSAATLAACSSTNEDTDLITMKGDTITVADFYKEVKNTSAAKQSMLSLVLTKVFEDQYGDKVSDKKVTESYNKTAASYGSSFSNALAAAGLTEESYKQQIRTTMLVEYAVEQAAKKELTDENYKSAYENYNPETTAQVIKLTDEETANSVLSEVKADGADFAAIAKEKTTADDSKYEYTFDSADTTLPAEVRNAAFDLDEGGISDVIPVVNASAYSTSSDYYIVKTIKKTEKDSDWKTYKKSLKKIIMAQYENDTSFQNQVIAAALEKANVKIKDDAFADILSEYATSSSSSSSDAATTTADSTTAAETTTEAESE